LCPYNYLKTLVDIGYLLAVFMVITAIKLLNKNLKATFLLGVVARVFWIVVKWFYGPS